MISYNVLPTSEAMIVPSPPIRLMTPLACERKGEGVISGIRATTGVRQKAMLSSRVLVQATKSGKIAAIGIGDWTVQSLIDAGKDAVRPVDIRTEPFFLGSDVENHVLSLGRFSGGAGFGGTELDQIGENR